MDRHRRRKRAAPCFFLLSASLFFLGKKITSSLVLSCIASAVCFRCSAYAARHGDRLTLTTAAACQDAAGRDRSSKKKKKKNTCIPPSRDPISSSAGRDAATRPRPAPESRHRRRDRPGQISTSQERENVLARLFFCPSDPCNQRKGKKGREQMYDASAPGRGD